MSGPPISVGSDRISLAGDALSRRTECGQLIWRTPADEGDAWVEMRLEADRLLANSWNGWLVHIDPATGAVLDRQLVK